MTSSYGRGQAQTDLMQFNRVTVVGDLGSAALIRVATPEAVTRGSVVGKEWHENSMSEEMPLVSIEVPT